MHNAITILGLITLRNNLLLFFYFFIGICLSIISNTILKKIIKQPRPCINIHLFDVMLQNGEEYVCRNDQKYHIFGMPSGHSQICSYTFMFLTLFLKNLYVSVFYLLITLITIYQRVKYDHHTTIQVIIGAIIGCILGAIMYYISIKKIAGNLTEKEDDNCYL